jgi:hypothetical protein
MADKKPGVARTAGFFVAPALRLETCGYRLELRRTQGDVHGTSTRENCVLACVECNKRKADRTPQQAGMRFDQAPVPPIWKPVYARDSVRIESWSKVCEV